MTDDELAEQKYKWVTAGAKDKTNIAMLLESAEKTKDVLFLLH